MVDFVNKITVLLLAFGDANESKKVLNKTNIVKFSQIKREINNCEVITIQILAETEYQDLYRVTDGVLLVVNKFKPIDYSEKTDRHIYLYSSSAKSCKYNKSCQDCLKVLKNDYYDKYADVMIPKGTVLYHSTPVELTTDELEYQYQIKTTGDLFSGDVNEMENMLSDILYRIRQGKCR